MSSRSTSKTKPRPMSRKVAHCVLHETSKVLAKCNRSKVINIGSVEQLYAEVPKLDQHTHTTIVIADVLGCIRMEELQDASRKCLTLGRKGCDVVVVTSKGIPPVEDVVMAFDKFYKFKHHKTFSPGKGLRGDIIVLEQR